MLKMLDECASTLCMQPLQPLCSSIQACVGIHDKHVEAITLDVFHHPNYKEKNLEVKTPEGTWTMSRAGKREWRLCEV